MPEDSLEPEDKVPEGSPGILGEGSEYEDKDEQEDDCMSSPEAVVCKIGA